LLIITFLLAGFEVESTRAQGQLPITDRLAAIRGRAQLRVCVWPEYFGMGWRNPRHGELEGMDIDMARALAGRLGVSLAFVETSPSGFAERLEAGACDVAMMGVGLQPGRQEGLAFSKPYLASPAQAVTLRASPRVRQWADIDRPDRVVAVAAGTTAEAAMRFTLHQARLMVVQPPRTLTAELLAGRVDVVMADLPYARGALAAGDWARSIEPPDRVGESLYAYAVARGDTAWLAEVNAFLTTAKTDGILARAAMRYGLTSAIVY
jgi:ABC-type amino acid transport substrate-binding protein